MLHQQVFKTDERLPSSPTRCVPIAIHCACLVGALTPHAPSTLPPNNIQEILMIDFG